MGVGCRFLPGGWVDVLPTRPTHGGGCHPPDTHRYRCGDGWLDGCENCLISRPNLHNFAQQPPRTMPKSSPKVASKKSSSAHHGELLAEELGFAEENSEFEPLMHPKSDTHCPHPIPATSSMQMGAYPSTHTHPEFSSGNTRHPPTHDKMWSGRQPWALGLQNASNRR